MAGHIGRYLSLVCLLASTGSVWSATSKPCSPLKTDDGYVCVCNSTYCDTIPAPTTLKTGKYHLYSTSATSPGFNHIKGSFATSGDSPVEQSASEVHVTIDSSTTYQTFSGVGAGMSDSSAYVYSKLPTAAKKNLMASFFGKSGIELTFGRVPIGCTDFSLNYYSYDDTDGDVNMADFALTTFETGTKMPFIQAAVSATDRTLNLLSTPWTSPSWMKSNNDYLPGTLISSYNEAFAKYIIKFLDAYKEQGIEFWGLSPLNEMMFGSQIQFQMPNVIMYPAQMKTLIRDYLGPMMEDGGYGDLKVVALDDERTFLANAAETLLSDNETAQYIDGFGIHWYSDNDNNVDVLDDFHTKYPDQFILYTEASGSDSNRVGRRFTGEVPPRVGAPSTVDRVGAVMGGSWDFAVRYIDSIIQNYQHWSVGYMCWNLCLNTDGGPYMQMSQEAPAIIDTSSGEFYKQPFYYALGHFSKFIYPGSVRVGLTVVDSSENPWSPSVDGIAATNPDGSTTVIVYNPSSSEVTLVIDDTNAGTITATVEAESLNTFMYW